MEAIYEAGYELDTIFTLKDDMAVGKSGRIFVDEFAQQHGVAVHKLRHVNDADAVEKYRNLDWLFIIGWSQIAGPEVINAPKNGVLGIHPTLLPEGRGRAAIPWAILKGLTKTGITLFKLDEGVDTGPVLAQIEIPLDDQTTATNLYERVSAAHGDLMREVLPKLRSGKVQLHFQDESKATVWPGRCPEDGEILTAGSVRDAARLVRAVTRPYPGAYYFDTSGNKVIVWSAVESEDRPISNYLEFKDGYLAIHEAEIVPRPGK
jgi:methionyl-tRNA formyltransferase